jgi:hypothetical protein
VKKYIIRIELFFAIDDDYYRLNEAMKKQGFRRTIETEYGEAYELPSGEYSWTGDIAVNDVFEAAMRAVKPLGKRYGILCSETKTRLWAGLPAVRIPY